MMQQEINGNVTLNQPITRMILAHYDENDCIFLISNHCCSHLSTSKSPNVFSLMTTHLLTCDLPGIGGRIKSAPEEFEVEEIPAYQPCGSGPFLYLWVEKRDMGAEYFIRQVARRLAISDRDIGVAGLKDRHAVTRQMISVPEAVESKLSLLDGNGIRLLQASRHTNKLKIGHLHGNRFRILIRGSDVAAAERLQPILQRLNEEGLPNFYGSQRFGHDGATLAIGMALLRNEAMPVDSHGKGFDVRNRFLRKLALSAAQAVLFNQYLSMRLRDGYLRRVLSGDVMAKWPMGGLFVAEDVRREQQRFDTRETVSTGPIFGRKTFPARGEAAEREADILKAASLTKDSFAGFGKLVQGTRRHNLVYPGELSHAIEPDGIRLTFTLPAGSYATVLLREVMKTAVAGEDEPLDS
jgi:tRNA pseudouridine13 synthase